MNTSVTQVAHGGEAIYTSPPSKNFELLWNFLHQILFHSKVLESIDERSPSSFESARLEAMWYALLTVKTPLLLPNQMRLSSGRL